METGPVHVGGDACRAATQEGGRELDGRIGRPSQCPLLAHTFQNGPNSILLSVQHRCVTRVSMYPKACAVSLFELQKECLHAWMIK